MRGFIEVLTQSLWYTLEWSMVDHGGSLLDHSISLITICYICIYRYIEIYIFGSSSSNSTFVSLVKRSSIFAFLMVIFIFMLPIYSNSPIKCL